MYPGNTWLSDLIRGKYRYSGEAIRINPVILAQIDSKYPDNRNTYQQYL